MGCDVRAKAATVWRTRTAFELQAAARFLSVRRLLCDARAPELLVDLADAAAQDELRHAQACADLADYFGGDAPVVHAPAAAAPLDPDGPTEVQVLHELVAMSCITESLSTALLLALVERATDGRTKDVMRGIVRDEVRHARLGWAYLSFAPRSTAHDVVAARLPALLADAVTPELFHDGPESPEVRALVGVGQLPRAMRRGIVLDTLDEVVFPGLSRFGIDPEPGQAWARRASLGGRARMRGRPRRLASA